MNGTATRRALALTLLLASLGAGAAVVAAAVDAEHPVVERNKTTLSTDGKHSIGPEDLRKIPVDSSYAGTGGIQPHPLSVQQGDEFTFNMIAGGSNWFFKTQLHNAIPVSQ